MAILDRLGLPAPDWRALDRDAQLAKRLGRAYRKPVRDVLGEIERIKSLPRRPPIDLASARGEALVELMTARLRRPDWASRKCACKERWGRCIDRLLPAQAWELYEAPLAGGIFGCLGAGSGKCVVGSTEVFDAASARRRTVDEIGPLRTLSLNYDYSLCYVDAHAFPSGSKTCYGIMLDDGSSLVLSYDHKVLTQRGWVEAQHLLIEEDFVATPTRVPEPEVHTEATDDEVRLIALLLADGGCNNASISFTNETPVVVSEFQRLANTVCRGWSERSSYTNAREFTVLGAATGVAGDRWRGGTGFRQKWGLYGLSKDKRLDARLWGLPQRQVALFLNYFWACDGYVGERGLEVGLASEKLIDDLRFMLLRLGIRSRKHYKVAKLNGQGFDSWRLMVYAGEALRFFDVVGEVLGKEDASRALWESLLSTARNPNKDTVPVVKTDVTLICDDLGLPPNRHGDTRNNNQLTRLGVRSMLGLSKDTVSRERFIGFCEQVGYRGRFSHLASRDVAWERVSHKIVVGDLPVYDLNVPATHNFVANGMIIHNTLADILTPIVMRPRLAVLFVPPGLTEQLWVEYQRVAEHFLVPSLIFQDGSRDRGRFIVGAPPLHVVPYSILQRPERTTLLRGLDPDLIIADEGHYLRNVAGSARGSRLLDHMVEKPDTGFCVWSGTLVAKSIRDFAHLLAFALGDQSPLPQHPEAVAELAQAVDPSNFGGTPDPGALAALMEPGEDAREAVRRRVSETLGVIETRASACDASIYILERKPPPMPEHLAEFLRDFRRTQVLHMDEGDEDVADPLQVARICQQVACGFYYKWIFPRGEPEELILEWYAARKEWHRELREKLKQPSPHLDSPFLCASAASRFYRGRDERGRVVERGASCDACEGSGRVKCVCAGGLVAYMPPMSVGAMLGSALDDDLDPVAETCRRCKGDGDVSCGVCGGGGGGVYKGSLPTWAAESWPRWVAVRDLVYHETKAVWLDDYLARDAADWGLSERGVVWYEHDAFGRKVSEVSGLPLHGGGPGAEARILAERGDRSIVASIRAHGTGRDGLQRIFTKQLLTSPPSSADRFEQCLDAQTEILTTRGWLGIDDPRWVDCQVAAYDVATGVIEWQSATARTERRLGYEKMYGVCNNYTDIRVTAGHRMIVQRPVHVRREAPAFEYTPPYVVEAMNMPRAGRIPVCGRQQARGVPLTHDELVFIGLVMTDGHYAERNETISLFQSERYPKNIELIEWTIARCGFSASRRIQTGSTEYAPDGRQYPLHWWTISEHKHSDKGWRRLAGYLDKDGSNLLEDVTADQLASLLLGMWAGDGSKTPGTYEYNRYEPSTWSICSSRQHVVEQIQSLCVRRGFRCNTSVADGGPGRKPVHFMRVSTSMTWEIRRAASDTRPLWRELPADPNERVWCATVPSGAIVTRRNGKVAVVGNCLARLHRIGFVGDSVETRVYRHTPEMREAIDKAVRLAKFVQGISGNLQKLLIANCDFIEKS